MKTFFIALGFLVSVAGVCLSLVIHGSPYLAFWLSVLTFSGFLYKDDN